jgi:hypothetical protein
MFWNAIILYGSSFPGTAATQNCGHTQGTSLTSLLLIPCHPHPVLYDILLCSVLRLITGHADAGTMYAFTTSGLIIPVRSRTKYVLRQTWVVYKDVAPPTGSTFGRICVQLLNYLVNVDVAPPSTISMSSPYSIIVVDTPANSPWKRYLAGPSGI